MAVLALWLPLARSRFVLAAALGIGLAVAALECWDVQEGFTFDSCCRVMPGMPGGGNPKCWSGDFTFEACCLEELRGRVLRGLDLVASGQHRLASDELVQLVVQYAPGTPYIGMATAAWEKAVKYFRAELDAQPHSLSYHEVLFRGAGLDCDPELGADGLPAARDPYTEYIRCCDGEYLINTTCNVVLEMLSRALGPGRHRDAAEAKDQYYGNMSEMWAFHHFTPSVLQTVDGLETEANGGDRFDVQGAERINQELADIFRETGEPFLGIVWSEPLSIPGVTRFWSTKFTFGVYALTLLFDYLQRMGLSTVDLFEIGAGYASLPRFMSLAKAPLLKASRPVLVRNFAVMDVRSAIDLQRWYLNKTVRNHMRQSDWSDPSHPCFTWDCWKSEVGMWSLSRLKPSSPEQHEGPLNVDFVDPERNNIFAHHFSTTHATEELGAGQVRALIAINSWHEFSMQDFMWHYNTFVAAPRSRLGVDIIFYVSNRRWTGNEVKEALLLNVPPPAKFALELEDCTPVTCVRLLRRLPGY